MKKFFIIILCFSFIFTINAQNASQNIKSSTSAQSIDPTVLEKIKKEGGENSKVMDIAFYLTEVSGPRLTASPGFMRAATWAKDELLKWGLTNSHVDPWGEFGRGWQQERCYIAMSAPYYQPLIAVPRAWTGSTPGDKMISGDVVMIKAKDTTELSGFAGKLKGKIVMVWSNAVLKPSLEADGKRFSETELKIMATKTEGVNNRQVLQVDSTQRQAMMQRNLMQRKINDFIIKEKPALILSMNERGNDGTIFVSSGGSFTKDGEEPPANVMLSSDDFLKIQRLLNSGIKVKLEADVKTKFMKDDLNGYNVIAEIPGTDPLLKDELVMIGGHLDSWHAATGATDNAAGCAVMMEAVRILQTIGVKPRRTIRIALWGGEEQGLIGSRNYVKNTFADLATMQLKPEHEKISAYYNLDNGTGRIRGIYLQGNKEAGNVFNEWLQSFGDEEAKTITISNTGGTDHQSFDAVGIPGFQFIQDPLEYDTRTHHTNMDTYDHLVPEDLKQAAQVVAYFVYNTAQRDEKIPRKQLPKPRGETQRGF